MAHYNELCGGVTDQAGKAFIPMHVRDKILILAGRAVQSPKSQPARTTPSQFKKKMPLATEQKGNLLIHDIW